MKLFVKDPQFSTTYLLLYNHFSTTQASTSDFINEHIWYNSVPTRIDRDSGEHPVLLAIPGGLTAKATTNLTHAQQLAQVTII